MKKPKKSPVGYAALVFAVFVLLCLIALICLSSVEASAKDTGPNFRSICKKIPEPEGEWWNGGHLFLLKRDKNGHAVAQLGWVKWKGHLYYCHKTASKKYPLGSATRGEIRDRGSNHWVAFDDKGRRITQDQYVGKGPRRRAKSLELDKNGYVKYIYNTALCYRHIRYSMQEHRRQEQVKGRWVSVGQQYYPDCVDLQR